MFFRFFFRVLGCAGQPRGPMGPLGTQGFLLFLFSLAFREKIRRSRIFFAFKGAHRASDDDSRRVGRANATKKREKKSGVAGFFSLAKEKNTERSLRGPSRVLSFSLTAAGSPPYLTYIYYADALPSGPQSGPEF